MLILTRKINETIIIDDCVEVKILGIKGSQIRLGITADKNISVHRKEIADKIKSDIGNENTKETNNSTKPNIIYKKSKC